MKASLALAAELREQIARGVVAPGDALPVESELMERHGVSKGVAREALRILETEGLVEIRRGVGGGPRVRHPSMSETAQSIGVRLQLGDVRVLDVWEARDRIIAAAVERLAVDRPVSAMADLDGAVTALGALVGDLDAYYSQLLDVEESAVRGAGNDTDLVLVAALRHIIASELEDATRAVADVEVAVNIEEQIAALWVEAAAHVRAGRPTEARAAYVTQADLVRTGMASRVGASTVVDIFRQGGPASQANPATSWGT